MASEASITFSALKFISCDSDHVCRLCFASTENEEVSLEDSRTMQGPFFDETVTLVSMFLELGVYTEDDLPQVLCSGCANTVQNAYLFKKLCLYSMEKWDKVLKRFEESLIQSEQINPDRKTAYIMFNDKDNIIFTSRNVVETKNAAVTNIKRIMHSRTTYAQKRKDNIACIECNAQFKTKAALSKHFKSHDASTHALTEQIPCPQCAKYFSSRTLLNDHAERIHYPKTIKCEKCTKSFATQKMLIRHEKLHHLAVLCKLCFKQYPSKMALKVHMDLHLSNKCEKCDKTFSSRQTYKLHEKICGNPDTTPKYFCEHCNKGYIRKNSIRTHLKVEHGFSKTLSCKWCAKKFDAVSRLKNHIVKHTKERNFTCDYCGGKFVTHAALVYHTRLHTGVKPFTCEVCDEKFLSSSRRMEHIRRKHMAPTKECPYCHVKFVTKHQLKKHIERHENPSSKLYIGPHTANSEGHDLTISTSSDLIQQKNYGSKVAQTDSNLVYDPSAYNMIQVMFRDSSQ